MRDDVLLHYGVKGMKWRKRKGKFIDTGNKYRKMKRQYRNGRYGEQILDEDTIDEDTIKEKTLGAKNMGATKKRKSNGKMSETSKKQVEESVNLVERRMQQVKRETQARQARQRMIMDEAHKTVEKAKNAMTKDAKQKQIQKGIKINQIKREWDKINDKVIPSRAKRKPKARPM